MRAEGILQLKFCLGFNGHESPEPRSFTYEGFDIQEDTSSKTSNRICAADFQNKEGEVMVLDIVCELICICTLLTLKKLRHIYIYIYW